MSKLLNESLTVRDVAAKTRVPKETTRRYLREYGDFMKLKRGDET
ncbi:hypothetical protein [Salipaludibacillus sp. CF4.18]